jgi:hypothetical protein
VGRDAELVTEAQEPTLIALEYDTSSTRRTHLSPISLFLYLAYLAFFIYVARSMRDMVAVHSRIGLTFTALVEIADKVLLGTRTNPLNTEGRRFRIQPPFSRLDPLSAKKHPILRSISLSRAKGCP